MILYRHPNFSLIKYFFDCRIASLHLVPHPTDKPAVFHLLNAEIKWAKSITTLQEGCRSESNPFVHYVPVSNLGLAIINYYDCYGFWWLENQKGLPREENSHWPSRADKKRH